MSLRATGRPAPSCGATELHTTGFARQAEVDTGSGVSRAIMTRHPQPAAHAQKPGARGLPSAI
jgi:hypothetical protein